MKFKSFMAMLVAGLLCIASFPACSDDDDDSKTYDYQIKMELTSPGDLSQTDVAAIKAAMSSAETQFGTQEITYKKAKEAFYTMVESLEKSFASQSLGNKQTVKITISMFNASSNKTDFSQVLEIKPKA